MEFSEPVKLSEKILNALAPFASEAERNLPSSIRGKIYQQERRRAYRLAEKVIVQTSALACRLFNTA